MNAIAGAVVAFAITLGLVPVIRFACRRANVLDRPGPLKIHTRPVPRLGGVAIFAGVVAGVVIALPHGFAGESFCACAAVLVWLVGLVDDIRGLHPGLRIVAQLVAAALVWQSGSRPAFLSGGAGFAAIALIVVLFVNAFNFLDGADGLCAGVAGIAALAYLALPQHALPAIVVVLAACTAAASAAFLVFNAPRASIFMGDSGSTTLGFLFALMALGPTYVAGSSRRLILFPFVILTVPLLDALRIVATRVMHRQSPLFGDREHAYDLFFARGWKPWPVVLVFWLMTAVCGFAGIFLVRGNSYAPVVVAMTWLVISMAILASATNAGREPHKIAQDPEPSPCKTEFS